MSIEFFFTKKKTTDLPSNCANFLKERLEDCSKKSKRSAERESSNPSGDELSKKELQKQLNEANETIKNLNEIISKQKSDIKLLKHSLNSSNRLCVQKDLKIERLKNDTNSQTNKPKNSVLFHKFEESISSVVLRELKSVPNGQTNDSTFVLKLMRHLYANDLQVLLNKSSCGKNKVPITPKKKSLIEEILKERVVADEKDENRIVLRAGRVGTLINDAIKNIVRQLKNQAGNKPSNSTTTYTNQSSSHRSAPVTSEPPPLTPIAKKRKLLHSFEH